MKIPIIALTRLRHVSLPEKKQKCLHKRAPNEKTIDEIHRLLYNFEKKFYVGNRENGAAICKKILISDVLLHRFAIGDLRIVALST